MPLSYVARPAINQILASNPKEALIITGSLLAAGAGSVTLRKILHSVGLEETSMTDEERVELELLDSSAPKHFWTRGVTAIHSSLLAGNFHGHTSRLSWRNGDWRINNKGIVLNSDPMLEDTPTAYDLVDVTTPRLVDGKLV